MSIEKNNITIKKGLWATDFFVFVAAFLIIYGTYILFVDNPIGYYLIPIGMVILIPQKGISIDVENHTLKHYISILGLKMGKAKSINNFTATTILHVKRQFALFDLVFGLPTNREMVLSRSQQFQVVLLTKNHRKKLVLKEFNAQKSAKKLIERLTSTGVFRYEKYHPQLSETSAIKRNR